MKDFGSFHRYWTEWQGKLEAPIARKSSKLRFPSALNEKGKGDGIFELVPPHPICIYNAPQKASSGKRGASHQQTIFIDGAFTLKRSDTGPHLVTGKCSISFFETVRGRDGACILRELDALHFDMESTSSPKAYHPTFHVQRDRSNTLTDDSIREALVELDRGLDREKIAIHRSQGLGTQHLRLPTPQMDMFAVLTMVIADFFCNGGDNDPKVKAQFKAILRYLTDRSNLAREGVDAKVLNGRAGGNYSCPAHWYPEFI